MKSSLAKDTVAILKSRTVLTLLFMFCMNVADAYGKMIDPQLLSLINGLLTVLAAYFRINTKQNFTVK